MPLAMVRDDVASGELVIIQLENFQAQSQQIQMYAVYRRDVPPGPAGRWFLDRLKERAQWPDVP
jgi:DNA-binding transcriptional LysR family regulator